jgi:uncharacterized protein with von Willebrand factor type A (vWA) domain
MTYHYHDRYRYSRWDGSQEISPFTAEDIMDAISDDLLAEGDLQRALQRLFRQGTEREDGRQMPGLRQMMERMRQRRQQQQGRYDLGSVLEDIEKQLDEIVQTEREGIERRLDDGRERLQQQQGDQSGQSGESGQAGESGDAGEGGDEASEYDENIHNLLERMAAKNRQKLDALPDDMAGQIRELTDYDFMDPNARQQFQQLLEQLQQQVLQQTFQGMQQALENMSPEQLDDMRNMLHDLNEMLEQRQRGEEPDFERFMHKYGHYFGDDINSLDELLDRMAQQMAAMQSLMDSMSPEQRQQLQDAMNAVMNDPGIQEEMQKLGEHLGQMMPENPYSSSYEFTGGEELSLQEAMRMMDTLREMEEMEQQLGSVRDWRDLENIDNDRIRELMGDDVSRDLEQLQQLTKILEEAGYIERNRGRYELTPRGVRKIGQKALQDIFRHLNQDRIGQHEMDRAGAGMDRLDESKPYEFGDPFLLDLRQTVMNAVNREGAGSPVNLAPQDFEVFRTETLTRSSTVLMIDMSRSMLYNGCYLAAKKVALALDSLIRTQFPRDDFHIIGFSSVATRMKPSHLANISWNEDTVGTNLQHGLMLSRQLLSRDKGSNKQIIVITDGEPTAHFDGQQVYFNYPPTYVTLHETLKEVKRCTRDNITINTFMLERSPIMASFISEMAKINKGRAFFADANNLGEYILVDYVANRRSLVT